MCTWEYKGKTRITLVKYQDFLGSLTVFGKGGVNSRTKKKLFVSCNPTLTRFYSKKFLPFFS